LIQYACRPVLLATQAGDKLESVMVMMYSLSKRPSAMMLSSDGRQTLFFSCSHLFKYAKPALFGTAAAVLSRKSANRCKFFACRFRPVGCNLNVPDDLSYPWKRFQNLPSGL